MHSWCKYGECGLNRSASGVTSHCAANKVIETDRQTDGQTQLMTIPLPGFGQNGRGVKTIPPCSQPFSWSIVYLEIYVCANDTHCTCCEQPANDCPPWDDVWAEDLIGWMNHCTNVTYEIPSKWLTLRRREILKQVDRKQFLTSVQLMPKILLSFILNNHYWPVMMTTSITITTTTTTTTTNNNNINDAWYRSLDLQFHCLAHENQV